MPSLDNRDARGKSEDAVGAGVDAYRRYIAPADDALVIENDQRPFREAVLISIDAV
jgi:hypothetical protein